MIRNTPPQHWLINNRSGNQSGERLLKQLEKCPGVQAEALDFSRLEQQLSAASSASRLVVAGGDGTFSAVLSSQHLGSTPVVCMPLGTANDLSRELGIPNLVRRLKPEELPTAFSSIQIKPMAVWQARSGDRAMPFCAYLALGYEAAVVHDFSRWRQSTRWSNRATNRLVYSCYGLRRMFTRLNGIEVSVDGRPAGACPSSASLIVSNIGSHLGLGLANRNCSPFDETIECLAPRTAFSYGTMIGASLGVASPPKHFASGKTIRLEKIPPETALHIDGEPQPPLQTYGLEVSLLRFANVATLT